MTKLEIKHLMPGVLLERKERKKFPNFLEYALIISRPEQNFYDGCLVFRMISIDGKISTQKDYFNFFSIAQNYDLAC